MENTSENCLTDDNSSKTDNDGTTSHIYIGKSLILCKQCTGKSYKTIGDHKTENFAQICIYALCPGHVGVTSRSAQGAAEFCTKEPVENSNKNNTYHCYNKDSVFGQIGVFNMAQGNQKIIFIYVNCLVSFSHDF